jgi:hypothetical protein
MRREVLAGPRALVHLGLGRRERLAHLDRGQLGEPLAPLAQQRTRAGQDRQPGPRPVLATSER